MKTFFLLFSVLIATCEKQVAKQAMDAPPAPAGQSIKYLALGDSYTVGTAIGQENAYPFLLKSKLESENSIEDVNLTVIAKNGWTTDNLLHGVNMGKPESNFDMVTLLIGVNNQYQGKSQSQYRVQFRELLQRSIGYAGGDIQRVFVLSVPDWSVTPAGGRRNLQAIAEEIDRFNQINREITDSMGVTYFDITPVSRTAASDYDLVASDGLHFSKEMHELWLKAIYEGIKRAVGQG